nr:hypothetical protein [Tanacetum cinerariifolium]
MNEIILQTKLLEVVLLYLVRSYYEVTPPDSIPLRHIFWGCYRLVMGAPAILVSANSFKGSFGDTIGIGLDVIHPVLVALVVFPAATLRALRDRVDVAETESASLCASIRTMGEFETVHRNHMRDERKTRIEIERQLASVQESYRQEREDFKKLKEFMTSQYIYHS